jgi:glycerophosphoryl diester phosphodiesterase
MATVSGCTPFDDAPSEPTAHRTPLADRLAADATRAPLVVAHRGSSAVWPENTLPAFQAGVEEGADMVELDVRTTADGVLVCLHDVTLDRTTDAEIVLGRNGIPVLDVPADELTQFDAGSFRGPSHAGTRIPTLAAALGQLSERTVLMVEHKSCEPKAMLDALEAAGCTDRVLVQSFDWDWLRAVRALAPNLTLGALGSGELTPERLDEIDGLDVSMVHWSANTLRLDDVRALRAKGYLVCVYTVDAELSLIGCVEAGLDAITTNRPALLRRLLARR